MLYRLSYGLTQFHIGGWRATDAVGPIARWLVMASADCNEERFGV
ncbi:MAG TPA: hypothetical protein VKW08_05790 [Xanthobacteraceae bacterium]|nr:hypothetical protein [Xanthobacteraceae bacterium]